MHMNLGIVGKAKRTACEVTLTQVHILALLPLGYVILSKLFSLFFNSKLGKIKPTNRVWCKNQYDNILKRFSPVYVPIWYMCHHY